MKRFALSAVMVAAAVLISGWLYDFTNLIALAIAALVGHVASAYAYDIVSRARKGTPFGRRVVLQQTAQHVLLYAGAGFLLAVSTHRTDATAIAFTILGATVGLTGNYVADLSFTKWALYAMIAVLLVTNRWAGWSWYYSAVVATFTCFAVLFVTGVFTDDTEYDPYSEIGDRRVELPDPVRVFT